MNTRDHVFEAIQIARDGQREVDALVAGLFCRGTTRNGDCHCEACTIAAAIRNKTTLEEAYHSVMRDNKPEAGGGAA